MQNNNIMINSIAINLPHPISNIFKIFQLESIGNFESFFCCIISQRSTIDTSELPNDRFRIKNLNCFFIE